MNITFVRAFLPQFDSRMKKYVNALRQHGHSVRFIGWARGQESPPASSVDIDLYPRQARLGGGWGNLLALLGWNVFVLRTLIRRRRQIAVVHAVDLDSAMAAWLFCRMFGKPLVFDIYDHYSDTRRVRGLARVLFNALERFIARHADLTLLADECRYAQHGLTHADNLMVIENVPDCVVHSQPLDPDEQGPIRIGYLGVLEAQHRGLENLLKAFAGHPGVVLHFGGYGPLELTIAAASRAHKNVIYHGALDHDRGMQILADMHCIVGFYYLDVPNHRYAAPNKYYEHLFLGRALLTTAGTPPGDKVSQAGTGWSLEETPEALQAWISHVTKAELARRGCRAREVWQDKYLTYYQDTLSGRYVNTLEEMIRQTKRQEPA